MLGKYTVNVIYDLFGEFWVDVLNRLAFMLTLSLYSSDLLRIFFVDVLVLVVVLVIQVHSEPKAYVSEFFFDFAHRPLS